MSGASRLTASYSPVSSGGSNEISFKDRCLVNLDFLVFQSCRNS